MAKFLGYQHISGDRAPASKLKLPASVVADYIARVKIVLSAGLSKEDEKRTRRHELDIIALCALVDGKNLDATDKQQLYQVIRNGFIRAYGQGEAHAKRNKMDERPYLMELRKSFAIAEDGGVTPDEGTVSQTIVDTYKTVSERSMPLEQARAA